MKIRTLKFHRARNYDYWLISEYSEKFPINKTEAKKKKKVGTNEERQTFLKMELISSFIKFQIMK